MSEQPPTPIASATADSGVKKRGLNRCAFGKHLEPEVDRRSSGEGAQNPRTHAHRRGHLEYAEQVEQALRAAKVKEALPSVQLQEFDTYSSCVEALSQGTIDAMTTDATILNGYAAQNEGKFKVVELEKDGRASLTF